MAKTIPYSPGRKTLPTGMRWKPCWAWCTGAPGARRFGGLVRRRRLKRGLSQERLGEISGLHRNYIGAVERAERTPSIVAADRLARALGTTLTVMFAELERGPDIFNDV